jgi:hypothetical protein
MKLTLLQMSHVPEEIFQCQLDNLLAINTILYGATGWAG